MLDNHFPDMDDESGGPSRGTVLEKQDSSPFYTDLLSYDSPARNSRWAIPWSDLMMTMFIFFVVLYIYQTADRQLLFGRGPGKNSLSETGAGGVISINEENTPSQVYDQARKAIQDVLVGRQSFFDLGPDKAVRIILASDLLFDSGQAELKTGARYQMDQIARALNENTYIINVVGHTDDLPTNPTGFPTNWELSSERATRVARYLMEEGGVNPDRFFISAHAFYQPVAPNDGPENRTLNRRVEIILTRDKPYASSN